ncbi:MAG TPA: ribosome-associated translation inhibitor RaiA [Opitutaceae bacterium]
MTHIISPERVSEKLIVSGIHLELTDALKNAIRDKVARLLRHEPRIVRIRIDLEYDKNKAVGAQFIAKGHIEIGGPDILASVASDDAYKSIDLLVDKLDAALRRRHSELKDKRQHPQAAEIGLLPKTA